MIRARLIGSVVLGLVVGVLIKRYALHPSRPAPTRSVKAGVPATNADQGKTPADLPPSYIRESEFPPDTFSGLSAQQLFTALKVANEKTCTCGCPNDSVAKCRTHDPDCTTAPRLLASIIADARTGLSSSDILTKMGEGASPTEAAGITYAIDLGVSPARGNPKAKVTLVELADFQCPFCQQMEPVLDQLRAQYGDDLRIVFKQNPLPFHNRAALAAEASLAAGDQGKFWEMHDLLFHTPPQLERADLERDAAALKLDLPAFRAALDHRAHQSIIDADALLALQLEETATPTFFINGRKLVGVQTKEALAAVIDEQKSAAEKVLAEGAAPDQVYFAVLEQAHARLPPPASPQRLSRIAHRVAVPAEAPSRGPEGAPVTLVEWGDFQCPFTARVEATLRQLREAYGDQLRVVWRNAPLPSHPAAVPAARAALAAGPQGKFWEVHDALLAHADGLQAEMLEGLVADAGVDVARWKKDLAAPAIDELLEADIHDGQAVGVLGTPSFFVNGLDVEGAQPLSTFSALIDGQLQRASALRAKGTAEAAISEQLMSQNVGASPVATVTGPSDVFADTAIPVEIGNAPSVGPRDAPVTVVEFSDFECFFSSRADAIGGALRARYQGRVRWVFKQDPLAFHPHAEAAAEAALAAADQGKYLAMHEQLFLGATALQAADLERYAKAAGLDLPRFKAALASGKLKERVHHDLTQAEAVGVTGTPTAFINGHRLVGAVSFDTWTHLLDAELARAVADAGQ